MSVVYKIGIAKNSSAKITSVNFINVVAGKGIVNDRFFLEQNKKKQHLTMIEKEKIDDYNKTNNSQIPYLDFRRNLITDSINLNELVGKMIKVGKVELKVHDLCEPCNHLERLLQKDNIVKSFIHKAGIRCEILNDGKISIDDLIVI